MGEMRLFSRVVKSRQTKKDKFFSFKTIFMIECLAFVYAAFVLTIMPGASEQKFAKQTAVSVDRINLCPTCDLYWSDFFSV